MSDYQYYTIDTNFFISGFGESPNLYVKMDEILNKMRIKIVVTNYVNREMRWYMRRVIEPFLIVKEVQQSDLERYMREVSKKVNIKLPQPPDVSVAYLAEKEKITLVSSDLRLVELAQQLNIEATMNSAFIIMLMEKTEDDKDRKFLKAVYNRVFTDEINYSVQSKGRYDPVIRIQKIMDSALEIVKKQSSHEIINKEKNIKTKVTYNFDEYNELKDVNHQIRSEISNFIDLINSGNYKKLKFMLGESSAKLTDLSTEVRMKGVTEEDAVYSEAITTLAHIYLLSSAVALSEQNLVDVKYFISQLLFIMLENKEVEERLDIEIHLHRITYLFLSGQFDRFKLYYSPAFIELCERRGREDIIALQRTMAIIIATLSMNKATETATARDFSEIEYIIQLGVQFIVIGKFYEAWLLLEQAVYMSLNSNMTGLLYAVFEVLLPLSFRTDYKFKPSFNELIKIVKKKEKSLPFDDYHRRSQHNTEVAPHLLTKRYIKVRNIPKNYSGFLDVISSEIVTFKGLGSCTFVKVIDWSNMNFIGIVDPSLSLDDKLSIGSSIKILDGKIKIIRASENMREKRSVDIVIICKSEGMQFAIRRAGQVSIPQSKINEYDI